ncbi:hypothetical protein DH2020_026762 [Rehmannia glutinosa]|uniref:XPG-I domain-containing protein n=1 Tax=Rehmannia glutinosa TaxID=99300 RepID=A0ABR0VW13_REHGL
MRLKLDLSNAYDRVKSVMNGMEKLRATHNADDFMVTDNFRLSLEEAALKCSPMNLSFARDVHKDNQTFGSWNQTSTGNKEDIEKFSKRTVKVTKQHNEDCKRLLRLMGVPVIEAPSEAEAQCAALCKTDKVYAVASEDMDSLTFGAPRFLRHLMDPSSKKIPVMEFEVSKVLEELNLTMDQFIDLCILSGCDYCDSIKGIGGLTALKLIRQHGSIENILENISKERYQIPDDWPYQEARRLFKEPSVFIDDDQLELKWSPPDEEAIEKIKAAKNKSSQGRLESFFKPVATASVPAKRKETTDKTEKESAKKKTKAGAVKKKK